MKWQRNFANYFNKFINTLKKEREQRSLEDKYPWLDTDDEQKTHDEIRKILDKYINLDNSCLNEQEKKEVMDMLYSYKEAFSLRDEIGTCPNIEVEINVTDKSPFFIRSYHVPLGRKIRYSLIKKWSNYVILEYWKKDSQHTPTPIMLINRKLTKDKRVVTDLRHVNVRIAKNNLAYPLLRNTFSVLRSSKCEVLSVLHLNDALLTHLGCQKIQKGIVEYFHTLVAHLICTKECPWDLNISPSIWQSYINTILDCLQSKKYCEEIMDDLLLFTPSKEVTHGQIGRFIKGIVEEWVKDFSKDVPIV